MNIDDDSTGNLPETIPTGRSYGSAPGFVSAREKRLRGIQESSALYDSDASPEEKFLHEHFAKQHG